MAAKERLHLLFTAAILHDIGTCDAHNGDQRFEVEGADAAFHFLKSHGVSEADAHDVWTAIAVHTSPGIAEKISPLSRLVRMGVAMDFKRPAALRLSVESEIKAVEEEFPRGEIEKVLGDAVVGQVIGREEGVVAAKAPPSSWPGGLVRWKKENMEANGLNGAF